ncbi:MAG TPA: transcriptional repressor [Lentimicrobium sp.]|nr:transcriptional repressor [Lentimicrobium sp.]
MKAIRNRVLEELNKCGLKITPQRMAVLEVLLKSKNHPTAESIHNQVLESIPGISATTIYNTLDTFVKNGLVGRVKTDADVMRYEPVSEHHHHLYSSASDRMEDYYDQELDQLLTKYFKKKQIKNFSISEIRLQLMGDFEDNARTDGAG